MVTSGWAMVSGIAWDSQVPANPLPSPSLLLLYMHLDLEAQGVWEWWEGNGSCGVGWGKIVPLLGALDCECFWNG